MKILISALASVLPESGVPEEIVFIPEGSHRITPQSHPKGVLVNLPPEKGQEIAARFQSELERRLGENVKPWLDFEHSRKFPASGYPTSFRYQAGAGLMMAVGWSGSGRKAIEDKDVRYFSPEVYIGKDGVPTGIPERGPLGGLVTEPAFREITPLAASDAAHQEHETDPTPKTMKLLLAALNISPDSADAESAAVAAVNSLKETAGRVPVLQQEVTDLKGKVTAADNSLKEVRRSNGESLFARAVTAGLAKKEDEAVKGEYIEAAESDNKLAIKFLTERVVAAEGKAPATDRPSHLSKPIVASQAGGNGVPQGDHEFVAEARKKVAAGLAKTETDAFVLVASERPELYASYNEQFEAVA